MFEFQLGSGSAGDGFIASDSLRSSHVRKLGKGLVMLPHRALSLGHRLIDRGVVTYQSPLKRPKHVNITTIDQ